MPGPWAPSATFALFTSGEDALGRPRLCACCLLCVLSQRQPGLWEKGWMVRRTWDAAQLAPWSPGKAATSDQKEAGM